jgi:hypothetical protein
LVSTAAGDFTGLVNMRRDAAFAIAQPQVFICGDSSLKMTASVQAAIILRHASPYRQSTRNGEA